ncbi:5'-3' exonuclease [Antrihabitans sp. YC2-6]|uniref:5'-3' exonuclease n=1 Tax=Antrihabitans sp. YC2-6 TaxID=2799498 RepID=UPI0018F5C960|nr:5'-3' exonuclease [Antrihabitans sp. YC2-6]MBJ8345584.1 5'-3' exonuclease [Antrihabitans sp. YC2-6]
MSGPLLLLDGASLWFRAFHGVPDSIVGPDGKPVNALRGFTDMVAQLVTRHSPTRLVVCLDLDWRPQFRVDAIPTYKTHRLAPNGAATNTEEVPRMLTRQVPMILDVLRAAGIATAGADGFEADDVLGTLASREKTDDVVVVSGDRDLLQLVGDDPVPVRVFYVGRGLAKAELYGPTEVAAKYGVPLENAGDAYADLATLRGDSSDGLPGVAGVGEKTASALMLRFGSIQQLLAAVDDPDSDIARGVRSKLESARAYIEAAVPVVRVARDAEIKISGSDELGREPADAAELERLAAKHGAESSVARLLSAMRKR